MAEIHRTLFSMVLVAVISGGFALGGATVAFGERTRLLLKNCKVALFLGFCGYAAAGALCYLLVSVLAAWGEIQVKGAPLPDYGVVISALALVQTGRLELLPKDSVIDLTKISHAKESLHAKVRRVYYGYVYCSLVDSLSEDSKRRYFRHGLNATYSLDSLKSELSDWTEKWDDAPEGAKKRRARRVRTWLKELYGDQNFSYDQKRDAVAYALAKHAPEVARELIEDRAGLIVERGAFIWREEHSTPTMQEDEE